MSSAAIKRVRRSVLVWACRCTRCKHTWDSKGAKRPTRCPSCGAYNFDKPARPYRRRP